MDIVYKLTFTKRKAKNEVPFQYIGSKSNCTIEDGVILDKKGKPYYGSSTWKNYNQLVNEDDVRVDVLYVMEDGHHYNDLLNMERSLHEDLDVVADPTYFNLQIATISSFANPNYGTYKHQETGKVVRLPRDHPKVVSNEYVGYTRGMRGLLSEEEKQKRSKAMSGCNNHFFGKKHPQHLIDQIASKNRGRKLSEDTKEKMSLVRRGKPKSDQHKRAIGLASKGKISLKNVNTGQTIRISKEEASDLDFNIWVNPYKLRDKTPVSCPHCNLTKPNSSTFRRWHFDNCKEKNDEN